MSFNDLMITIKKYKKAYVNYLLILVKMLYKRNESRVSQVFINAKTRDGKMINLPYGIVDSYAVLKYFENKNLTNVNIVIHKNLLSFKFYNKQVLLDPGRYSDLYAVFVNEEYKFLRIEGKDVIDIGVNIGDSAIFFSITGAKRVIGLEPYPYAFSIAEKNVKINSLENIVLLNAGYGRDSKIFVNEDKVSSNSSSLISSPNGKEIPIISLKTLINQYNLKNAILKMDCEGCEYALLDEDDEIFNVIEMIQIEYHYGYDSLVNKLKKVGFDIIYTEPKKSYNPDAENPEMRTGYIYAFMKKVSDLYDAKANLVKN